MDKKDETGKQFRQMDKNDEIDVYWLAMRREQYNSSDKWIKMITDNFSMHREKANHSDKC